MFGPFSFGERAFAEQWTSGPFVGNAYSSPRLVLPVLVALVAPNFTLQNASTPFRNPTTQLANTQLPLMAPAQPLKQVVFVSLYYPYAITGPLFGNGTKIATPTFWKGRKTVTTPIGTQLNVVGNLYVNLGYWEVTYSV